MLTTSIAQEEILIQKGVHTAVIYSVPEISEYIVEINDTNNYLFIEKNGENIRYGNLSAAIAAAPAYSGAMIGHMPNMFTLPEGILN